MLEFKIRYERRGCGGSCLDMFGVRCHAVFRFRLPVCLPALNCTVADKQSYSAISQSDDHIFSNSRSIGWGWGSTLVGCCGILDMRIVSVLRLQCTLSLELVFKLGVMLIEATLECRDRPETFCR
jgi:hypothetical protein